MMDIFFGLVLLAFLALILSGAESKVTRWLDQSARDSENDRRKLEQILREIEAQLERGYP